MNKNKANFLIILSDCTRPDKLSCYGYNRTTTPNIDKLAKEGTIFTSAYTQGVWTLPTHASLFTGLYPSEHGLLSATEKLDVKLDKNIPTLAEQLKEEGYITAGISNNPWVGKLSGFDRGFDFFMESDGTIFDRIGINVEVPSSIKIIKNIQKLSKGFFFKLLIPYLIKRPVFTEFSINLAKKIVNYSQENDINFFIFMNLMDTHQPYYPPRKVLKKICNARSYFWSSFIANNKIRRFYKGDKINNISKILNDYYDASLHNQDQKLELLFSYMRSEKIIDDTMVFFTADHGKNLGEYDVNEDLNCMKDIFLKIPLIVRYPKLFSKDTKNENFVQLIDINYTIRNQLNLNSIHKDDLSLEESLFDNSRDYVYSEAELPFNFFEVHDQNSFNDYIKVVKNKDGKVIKSKLKGFAFSNHFNGLEEFIFDKNKINKKFLFYINFRNNKEINEKTLLKNVIKNKFK